MKQAVQNLERILLGIFLLLLPTQLGKHFWPDWSYVLGIRIDFLSPTLYLVDLIWLGLFFLNCFSEKKIFQFKKILNFKTFLLVLFVVINILVAENKGIAIYRWLRIFQIIWTVGFIKLRKVEVKKYLGVIIPVWIIGESILGLAQIINGGSIGGILYFLGERRFNIDTVGIAQMSVFGEAIIRAYGTFSHPNSLAGFLLVSLAVWVKYYGKLKWWMVWWFGILGIIISGSRLIWALTAGLIIYKVFQILKIRLLKNRKNILGISVVVLGLVLMIAGIIFGKDILGGWDKDSLIKRWNLNVAALKMIRESMWVGQGMGNFLVKLPDYQENNIWLQPVHNILLLAVSETGLLGLGVLILSMVNFYKKKVFSNLDKILIVIILITGMWDHYWLTLPQNWWLLTIVMGII